MVADNQSLKAQFTQLIAGQTGTMYEMLCTPEEAWLKLREEFIRDHGLEQQKKSQNETDHEMELLEPPPAEMPEGPFIDDAQPLASQDPLVTEAEKLFGKDFIEIVED
jgi:DNA polymerase-3 subunit gamma/tau